MKASLVSVGILAHVAFFAVDFGETLFCSPHEEIVFEDLECTYFQLLIKDTFFPKHKVTSLLLPSY